MTKGVLLAASIVTIITGGATVVPAHAQVEIVKDFVQYGTQSQAL
jgi:hypothetical protein